VNLGDYAETALKCEKKKILVSAGRLMPQKNQKVMIKAFSEAAKKHPDYQLVIYGEGPSREELEQLIKEKRIH
jgi:glycosyltransferase involved in cell wall biosynthesis